MVDLTEDIPEEEIGKPSRGVDLEELPKKEVSDSAERESFDIEARKMMARRFIAIAKNTGVFFFTFELGFNRCI